MEFLNCAEHALIIVIDFKNKKVKISRPLLRSLHLDIGINKSYDDFELELEHWFELCHPEDHENLINFEDVVLKNKDKNFISLNRRLYCGDGVYRNFSLDAFIERDNLTGEAAFLYGIETLCGSDLNGLNVPVMSAVQALKLIELFAANHRSQVPDIKKFTGIKDALLKLNIKLNKKLNENKKDFVIGVSGLSGSGKTEFINALNALKFKFNFINFIEIIEIDEDKIDENKPDIITECDVILYLVPVRAKLKYSDVKLLNAVSESGAKAAVLLTQIDVERDNTQAGEIIKNRVDILSDNIKKLKIELADNGLDLPVIPVSSKFAFAAEKEKGKNYVNASNFEPLIKQLENFYNYALQIRGRKALKLIERSVKYLDDLKHSSDLFKNDDAHGQSSAVRHGRFLNLFSLSTKHENLNLLETSYSALHDSLDDIKNALNFTSQPDINFTECNNINFAAWPDANNCNSANTPMLNLLKSINEEKLRERFLAIPFTNRRVIMLGAERHESIKLISRLVHDASLSDIDFEAARDEWLCTGQKAPVLTGGVHLISKNGDANLNNNNYDASELLSGLEILAAPSDAFINHNAVMTLNWHMLFAQWTPVINIDFLRIKASLQDLERAPYFKALAGVSRFVIAYSNGVFFNDRLSDLIIKIPEIIKNFMFKHRFRGRADWFIYENYDSRYTDFLNMGMQLGHDSSDEDIAALIALWEECGLGFEPPFTRENLNRVLKACTA